MAVSRPLFLNLLGSSVSGPSQITFHNGSFLFFPGFFLSLVFVGPKNFEVNPTQRNPWTPP